MNGISLSPLALLIGVLAYVLKRWWDSADNLTRSRQGAYAAYFSAAVSLVRNASVPTCSKDDVAVETAVAQLDAASPDFLLHASPIVMSISDVFIERVYALRAEHHNNPNGDKTLLVRRLGESLNVLREAMKSELFAFSPRFVWERFNHRRRWKKFVLENKK